MQYGVLGRKSVQESQKLSAQLDEHSPASNPVVSEERWKINLRAVRWRMNSLPVRPTG